jgi:DNA-binding NarL/FixJ family response regulator
MTTMAPRILIVDDHQIVRRGVRALLAEFRPAWEICGEAANAVEALKAVKDLQPNLVLLDITMPGSSGLELSSQIRALGYPCRILIFTMHHSSRLTSDVRAVGAQGFVLKSQAAGNLVFAIERILDGGTFYGSEAEGGGGSDPRPGGNISFFDQFPTT